MPTIARSQQRYDRRRVRKLMALLRLVLALLQTSGFRLSVARRTDATSCESCAVDRAREHLPLRALLRFLRVSPSRFHAWGRRQRACVLDDQSSCPRISPSRLTPSEIRAIKDLVTSPEYRHVPTGTLAVLAQRLGRVWASPSTWYRLPAAERLAPPPPPRAAGEATGGPADDSS